MGQVKNMLIEYIECMIAAGSHHTFEELQDLVMTDGSVEKAAFIRWYDTHGAADMVTLTDGQSCEILVNGHAAIVKITSFVSNGVVYEFNGSSFVLCSPRGKEMWHWWHIGDEDGLFDGVNYKIGVCLVNWEVNSEQRPQCVGVIANGCDSVTIL